MKLIRILYLSNLLLMIICSFFTYLEAIILIMLLQFGFLLILFSLLTIDWTKIQLLKVDNSKKNCIFYLIFMTVLTFCSFFLTAQPDRYYVVFKITTASIVIIFYLISIYFYKKMIFNLTPEISQLDDYKVNSDSVIGSLSIEVIMILVFSNVLSMNIKNFDQDKLFIFPLVLLVMFILFFFVMEKAYEISNNQMIIAKYRIISSLTFVLSNGIITLIVWLTGEKGTFLFIHSLLVLLDLPCFIIAKKITFQHLNINKKPSKC